MQIAGPNDDYLID